MTIKPTTTTTAETSGVGDASTARGSRVGDFVRRHPLLTLMLVFNTFGQALVFVPLTVKRSGGPALNLEVFQSISLVLFLLVPALLITRFVRGPQALRDLVHDAVRFRLAARWYLLPLVVVPLGCVLVSLPLRAGTGGSEVMTAYGVGFLPWLAIQFLSTNWWEELVWMGFVQIPLQRRYGAWRAVLLTTPLFALEHVVLYAGLPLPMALAQLALLTVVIVFVRALFAWVYNHTRSIGLVGLTHAAMNAGVAGFAGIANLPPQSTVMVALLGIVVLVATRGRLGLPKPLATPAEASADSPSGVPAHP